MKREGFTVARCTVARLMKVLGIEGVRRGKRCITTIPDDSADKRLDLVNREFAAQRPNQLWVADITYGVPGIRHLQGMHKRITNLSGIHTFETGVKNL